MPGIHYALFEGVPAAHRGLARLARTPNERSWALAEQIKGLSA
jgi:hypothetical protein